MNNEELRKVLRKFLFSGRLTFKEKEVVAICIAKLYKEDQREQSQRTSTT